MPTGEEWWPFGDDAVRDDPLTEKRISRGRQTKPTAPGPHPADTVACQRCDPHQAGADGM